MASVNEINAGVDAVRKQAPALVQLAPDRDIPFVGNLRQLLLEKVTSREAIPIILKLVKAALAAAEDVRAKAETKS